MAVATYKLAVDWNDDGLFTGTGEELAMTRVRSINCFNGRDQASQLTGRSVAGRLTAILDNRSRDYNSFNTASPITGNVLPGREVRLLGSSNALTDQPIWRGFLLRIIPRVSITGDAYAVLDAIGPLGQINVDQIVLAMQTSQRTDQLIGLILDDAGWPAGARSLDVGRTTITRYWADRQYTLHALQEIEGAEAGFLYETTDGKIGFKERRARLSGASLTSQATFSDATGAARPYSSIEQADLLETIFNIFEAEIQRYTVGSLAVLWTLDETGANSPRIQPNGGTIEIWAQFPNPDSAPEAWAVDAWTTPVATTDFTANSSSDGLGLDVTASIGVAVSKFAKAMKITLTNNHATSIARITFLQARGTPASSTDSVHVRAEDSASKTAYGERTWPAQSRFIPDLVEGKDWADYHLGIYKDPIPILTMSYWANRSQTMLDEMLTRKVGDRVTVVAQTNADLDINRDFFIEAVSHAIRNDRLHKVTYLLSDAESFSDFWVLGVSALGVNTRLAY